MSAIALSGLVALWLASLRACLWLSILPWIGLPLKRRPIATCVTVMIVRGNAHSSTRRAQCCKSRPRESFAGSDEILFPLPDSNAIAIPVLPFNSPEHEKPTWRRFERIQKLKTEIEVDDHDCSLLSSALLIARLLMDIQNPEGIFNRMLRLSLLSCLLKL